MFPGPCPSEHCLLRASLIDSEMCRWSGYQSEWISGLKAGGATPKMACFFLFDTWEDAGLGCCSHVVTRKGESWAAWWSRSVHHGNMTGWGPPDGRSMPHDTALCPWDFSVMWVYKCPLYTFLSPPPHSFPLTHHCYLSQFELDFLLFRNIAILPDRISVSFFFFKMALGKKKYYH